MLPLQPPATHGRQIWPHCLRDRGISPPMLGFTHLIQLCGSSIRRLQKQNLVSRNSPTAYWSLPSRPTSDPPLYKAWGTDLHGPPQTDIPTTTSPQIPSFPCYPYFS